MTDIRDKNDVALLIDLFYKKAVPDPIIGHFFTTVMQLDWEKHIPVIVSFWDGVLFGNSSYAGNPMVKHIELNKLSHLKAEHFNRWLQIWSQTVNDNFIGIKANEAISRAKSIAAIMQLKINRN